MGAPRRAESVGTQAQQKPGGWPDPRNRPGKRESARQQSSAYSQGQLVLGDYYCKLKPGGYTRHSWCFPPRKEVGSWAPGHLETSVGKKKKGGPFPQQGCLEGARDSSRVLPVPLRAWRSSPRAPGCPGGTGQPLDLQTPRGTLTWRALGPQRGWSMPAAGGCWAPWWCPCPAPQPGTEGTGLPHPAPKSGDHAKVRGSDGLWPLA